MIINFMSAHVDPIRPCDSLNDVSFKVQTAVAYVVGSKKAISPYLKTRVKVVALSLYSKSQRINAAYLERLEKYEGRTAEWMKLPAALRTPQLITWFEI